MATPRSPGRRTSRPPYLPPRDAAAAAAAAASASMFLLLPPPSCFCNLARAIPARSTLCFKGCRRERPHCELCHRPPQAGRAAREREERASSGRGEPATPYAVAASSPIFRKRAMFERMAAAAGVLRAEEEEEGRRGRQGWVVGAHRRPCLSRVRLARAGASLRRWDCAASPPSSTHASWYAPPVCVRLQALQDQMPTDLRFTASLPQKEQPYLRAKGGREGCRKVTGRRRRQQQQLRDTAAAGHALPSLSLAATHLACWLISIFLTILRSDAPKRVPYLPTIPTFFVRRCAAGRGGGGEVAAGSGQSSWLDDDGSFSERNRQRPHRARRFLCE